MSDDANMKFLEMLLKNGAHIGNFIMDNHGTMNVHAHGGKDQEETECSDEKIANAIAAICGDGKPLDSKRKWAAVHWFLRWAYNYPPTPKEFCERIATLPLNSLPYKCEYNSIRHFSTLTFMNQDARQIDKVKPNKQDEPFFLQCREVVQALEKEMQKSSISVPEE